MTSRRKDAQKAVVEKEEPSAPQEKTVVEAATTPKKPPPERPGSIRTRQLVILSFWAIAALLGLPIWWRTTTIYRASLPLQQMQDWSEGKACRPEFPLHITIEAPSLTPNDARHLLRTTQHALDDHNHFPAHHLRLGSSLKWASNAQGDQAGNEAVDEVDRSAYTALTVKLVNDAGLSSPVAVLEPFSSTLEIRYAPSHVPSSSSSAPALANFIAQELHAMFAEEQSILSFQLSHSSYKSQTRPLQLPPATMDMLEKRQTRSVKYSPTYHLTFSLFSPAGAPSEWAIAEALQEALLPVIEALRPISNFTVDTQVQLYAEFAPSMQKPQYDSKSKAWTLRKEDLSGFINAAEWPLNPSIGEGPTINFVLYAPSEENSPLVIKDNGGSSWLIPQWGGVQILNLPTGTKSMPLKLQKEQLKGAMHTFTNQLLSLLGVPESPKSLPLRLSTLTRARAASVLFSASSTLGSLARLVVALPSIEIPDTVANSVHKTIERLEAACADMRDGKFHSSLESGRVAEAEAEKAFFDPAMVGQVYFPDEHKVAVYIPLMGPVGVTLFLAAVKEIKAIFNRRKAAGKATTAK